MNALIIGASAGIGRAVAEQLAAKGINLFLVASDPRDLIPLAADLSIMHDITVKWAAIDLYQDPVENLYQHYFLHFKKIDMLFCIAGYGIPDEDTGAVDAKFAQKIMAINYSAHVRIINQFIDKLTQNQQSYCIGISSVATACPKDYNIIYTSAKKGLEHYFLCLKKRFARRRCKIQCYRMGFVKTSLLGNHQKLLPAVSPQWVAKKIIANLNKSSGLRYLPKWWAPVMLLYRILSPLLTVFKRLSQRDNTLATDSDNDRKKSLS